MSSSVAEEVQVEVEADVPDLVRTGLRPRRCRCPHFCPLETPSKHGIVIIVEETACLQAKVYLQRESAVLKEAIDDLEWPGSNIQINLLPFPPSVVFRGEGHGDLQIDFNYYAHTDLLIAFSCDRKISHRYKYKFLRATTSNIPSTVIRDNRGSKFTTGRGGMLKVQHLVAVANPVLHFLTMLGISNPDVLLTLNFSSSLR